MKLDPQPDRPGSASTRGATIDQWPPKIGELLPSVDDAYGVHEKLGDYSLKVSHASGGPKAEGFARVLAVRSDDLDYLAGELIAGGRTEPISEVRDRGGHGVLCEVVVPVRGLCDRADRVARVPTSWEIRWEGDPPRLVTAFIMTRLSKMTVVKNRIEENDVVALRERVGPWRAGTIGTDVSIYAGGALIEVSDEETGEAFDMFDVPFDQLELRWSHRTGWVDGMEA